MLYNVKQVLLSILLQFYRSRDAQRSVSMAPYGWRITRGVGVMKRGLGDKPCDGVFWWQW